MPYQNALLAGYNLGNDIHDRRRAAAEYPEQQRQRNELFNLDTRMKEAQIAETQAQAKQRAATAAKYDQDEARKVITAGVMRLHQVKDNPQAFAQLADYYAGLPIVQQIGITRDQITPESIDPIMQQILTAQGEVPKAPEEETFTGSPEPMNIDGKNVVARMGSRGTRQVVPGARPYERPVTPQAKPNYQFKEQVLPDGSVQVMRINVNDPQDQGEPWGAPKAPKMSSGNEKAMRDAQFRLADVSSVERNLDEIEQIGKSLTFGSGPIAGRVSQLGENYGAHEQKAGNILSQLTRLTRVPGIGSQSDLEQRLQQLQIPSINMDDLARRNSIAELRTFIADLRAAYENVASGNSAGVPGYYQSNPGQRQAEPRNTAPREFTTPNGTRVRIK
jgi:hypothetical protein